MQSNSLSAVNKSLKADSSLKSSDVIGNWQSWTITDIGKRRERNEDAVLNKPDAGLWAIADGMGGHQDGDVASQLIVDSLDRIHSDTDLQMSIEKVAGCLEMVNTQLREFARLRQNNDIIGSTVVVLIARQRHCAVLWAGDSRLYRLRNQHLQQLTQDHCPDHDYLIDYEWSVKVSNELTRAVGADEALELDCEIFEVCEGDMFLLCSDGLDKELMPNEIEQVLLSYEPEKIVEALLTLSLQRGAQDNISIVLVIAVKAG